MDASSGSGMQSLHRLTDEGHSKVPSIWIQVLIFILTNLELTWFKTQVLWTQVLIFILTNRGLVNLV